MMPGPLCLLAVLLATRAAAAPGQNLLFIMFDDLRPELSVYGHSYMLTPAFERLAQRSVVFDYAFCQVPVCNPSRNSLLTGLRPDTLGVYGFENSYKPHTILPVILQQEGYETYGYGKLLHWESNKKSIWTEHYRGKWAKEGFKDIRALNASCTPDKYKDEKTYLEYDVTTHAVNRLHYMKDHPEKKVMTSIGFKSPHSPMRVPAKYYMPYLEPDRAAATPWARANASHLTFPEGGGAMGYHCCAESKFVYLEEYGTVKSKRKIEMTKKAVTVPVPLQAHVELARGYAAMVSWVDSQVGRVLDALDELDLWNDVTVVLTSDHGMHNGEKGSWTKWMLFDESTRVPLLIASPHSPFPGQHYPHIVEHIDLLPTLVDLLQLPATRTCTQHFFKGVDTLCLPLQGKSLAPVLLGKHQTQTNTESKFNSVSQAALPLLPAQPLMASQIIFPSHQFAIQQKLSCRLKSQPMWVPCMPSLKFKAEVKEAVSGYSIRDKYFRYTIWLPFNITLWSLSMNLSPSMEKSVDIFYEELYDHRGETMKLYTRLETKNVIKSPLFAKEALYYKNFVLDFIRRNITFVSEFTKKNILSVTPQDKK